MNDDPGKSPTGDAFTLRPTPDGGLALYLNLARTAFSVFLSPTELATIRKRVETWHTDQHKKMATHVSGDVDPYVRREVTGCLMRKMAEVTPPGLMGAVAQSQLKKRAVAKKKPTPRRGLPPGKPPMPDKPKLDAVSKALKLVAGRRAMLISVKGRRSNQPNPVEKNQGQIFARAHFTRLGIPTRAVPHAFWGQSLQVVANKAAAAVNSAAAKGAPVVPPAITGKPPQKIEREKLAAIEKALKTIQTRRAGYLAWQRKPGSKVAIADINNGKVFAREFATKNGIPATAIPHPFWAQALPIIITKVNAVVKSAEAQGAPVRPPKPVKATPTTPAKRAPVRPVVTKVEKDKINLVRKGIQQLAARRSRFLAWKRKSRVTSPAEIAAGKQFARAHFTKKGIPVKEPTGKTHLSGDVTIRGWVYGHDVMGQDGGVKVSELAPQIKTGEAAHTGLNQAWNILQQGRRLADEKFGLMASLTGEKKNVLGTIADMEGKIQRLRPQIPRSGPLTESQSRQTATHIVLASDAFTYVDKYVGASLAREFAGSIASLYKKTIGVVVDAPTAFWSAPPAQIKQKVDDALKEVEKEAPASLPPLPSGPVSVLRPAPGTMPGGGGGRGGGDGGGPPGETPGIEDPGTLPEGETPGEMPADETPGAMTDFDPNVAPGDEPGPVSDPGPSAEDLPGGLATADEPGAENYQPGETADYGEMPEGEEPGEMSEAVTDPDSAFEAPEATEESSEETTAEETSEEQEGEGTMTGAYEIGAAPKTINKQKYEQIVRKRAAKVAHGLASYFRNHKMAVPGAGPTRAAIWAKAKQQVDAGLTKKGVTVAGDLLMGMSDIMGAAFVLGQAAKGTPKAKAAARKAIRKTVAAAKAGSPGAKKQVKALRIARKPAVARKALSPVLKSTGGTRRRLGGGGGFFSFGRPYFRGRAAA